MRTGSLFPTPDEVPNLWAYISGTANRGRFTQHSIRSAEQPGAARGAAVPTVPPSGDLAIVVDVQVVQMTLKASHPQEPLLINTHPYELTRRTAMKQEPLLTHSHSHEFTRIHTAHSREAGPPRQCGEDGGRARRLW